MLRSLKALDLYRVSASDGELGGIENVFDNDELAVAKAWLSA